MIVARKYLNGPSGSVQCTSAARRDADAAEHLVAGVEARPTGGARTSSPSRCGRWPNAAITSPVSLKRIAMDAVVGADPRARPRRCASSITCQCSCGLSIACGGPGELGEVAHCLADGRLVAHAARDRHAEHAIARKNPSPPANRSTTCRCGRSLRQAGRSPPSENATSWTSISSAAWNGCALPSSLRWIVPSWVRRTRAGVTPPLGKRTLEIAWTRSGSSVSSIWGMAMVFMPQSSDYPARRASVHVTIAIGD